MYRKFIGLNRNVRWLVGIFLVFGALYVLNLQKVLSDYYLQLIMFSCINVMMTVSLNLVNGYTGQFSIGHAGFMAIGAYVSAFITSVLTNSASFSPVGQYAVFFVAVLASILVAGLMGFLVGLPCLRVSGDYLAIVTLGFGEVIRAVIRLIPAVGGARGMTGIPKYSNLWIILAATLLVIILVRNLVNSAHGRACVSVRENEIAAGSVGVNAFKTKLMAFTIAAMMAGMAGALYSHLLCYAQPDLFSMIKSTDYLVFLYAGGAASISGSIVSAFVLTFLPEVIRFLATWRMAIYAGLLIIIMLFRPNGLCGGKEIPILRCKNYRLRLYVRPDCIARHLWRRADWGTHPPDTLCHHSRRLLDIRGYFRDAPHDCHEGRKA